MFPMVAPNHVKSLAESNFNDNILQTHKIQVNKAVYNSLKFCMYDLRVCVLMGISIYELTSIISDHSTSGRPTPSFGSICVQF